MIWWYIGAIAGWVILSLAVGVVRAKRSGRWGIKYVKPRAVLTTGIILVMAGVFSYGMLRYPDAPIHPCSGPTGYCGKQGQPHSLAEYQAFEFWQTTLISIWPIGMLALVALRWKTLTKRTN